MNFKPCTCTKCGWVSFGVSKEYAENEIKKFNEYFDSLPKETQEDHYGGRTSSIKNYTCMLCGGSKFRDFKEGDCPNGCTQNPVIREE